MRHVLGCNAMTVVPKETNGARQVSSYPLVPAQNFHLVYTGIYMGIDQSRESENAVGFPVVMGWDGMERESPIRDGARIVRVPGGSYFLVTVF